MRSPTRFLLSLLTLASSSFADEFLPGVQRILFLGDSITYSGQYVDDFEAFVALRYPERKFEVLNLGLPSETLSGLSEPGHADGKFPRPDLHERLDRVLAATKPDLVFACYGMNDGIYMPYSEERFGKYRAGMEKLREKVQAAGARIIHLTPPLFDRVPIEAKLDPTGKKPGAMYSEYDEVLTHYSEWLLEQRSAGWTVIDIHRTMRSILDARRASDPAFTFAKDGVHPNDGGHWIMAMELIGEISGGDRPEAMEVLNRLRDPSTAPDFLKSVRSRGRILVDAWLTKTGHLRPGMKAGLPLEEAQAKAAELTRQIQTQAELLGRAKETRRL